MNCRRMLSVCVLGILAFAGYAWYKGFVPGFDGPARAGVRHALDLRVLPFSARISASGMESWTDYLFEADLAISPEDFERLLSGRKFEKDTWNFGPAHQTQASRIEGYQGFLISESWSWSHRPKDLREGDHGSRCTIATNAALDRAFVRYTTD